MKKQRCLYIAFMILTGTCFFLSCQQKTREQEKEQHLPTGAQPASEENKDFPIELNDRLGNLVRLEQPAQRIVCLFDPIIDLIYMLGDEEKLVGIPVETYVDPELFVPLSQLDPRIATEQLPAPGSNELVKIEEVIALKPDLLIVQHLGEGMASTLKRMGISVYIARSMSQEDLFTELRDVALMTGNGERGRELSNYARNLLDKMEKRNLTRKNDPKKEVYFTWANGRIFSTAGRGSMMHDCLVYAGVENVCTTNIDQPNINPETLIGWNPDLIVMWNDSPDLFYKRKELSPVKAIANRRIYNLMPMFYYNPHTLKSLCASTAIHTWAYGQEENALPSVREIIEKLYGKEKSKRFQNLP